MAPQRDGAFLNDMRVVNNLFDPSPQATPQLFVDSSNGTIDFRHISNVTIADNSNVRGTRATAQVSWNGTLPTVCVPVESSGRPCSSFAHGLYALFSICHLNLTNPLPGAPD
jgi:hypothetical protein